MRRIKSIIFVLISFVIILTMSACNPFKVTPAQYTLVYMPGAGGKIMGEQIQIVDEGDDAETVTAVPNTGYEFVGWSDGVKTAERTDTNVKSDIDVTANFQLSNTVTYSLDYKFGTCENKKYEVTFKRNDFKTIDFPVPEREHFTFGGWYCGETQVTDANGEMVVGAELLNVNERDISAKWTADETFTYKVLLVYVTEIDAELQTISGETVKVDYHMSEVERKISEQTTVFFRETLNKMTDGLVNFEVDEYYTKDVVTTDEFSLSTRSNDTRREAYVDERKTKEMQEIYDNYYSVITIFNMEDYEGILHCTAGTGSTKFAIVHSESNYKQMLLDGYEIDELLNPKFRDWKRTWTSIIDCLLHEFTHTIECRAYMPLDFERDYHTASAALHNSFRPEASHEEADILATKYYLLNEAWLKGEKVGIPYEFWQQMHGKEYDHPLVWN
ncbi:MAG: InlB B-repeat-containing protein [Roseburia sp.]|nr:InlB B-repeat-containing protein [Roseburia sp.]